MTRIKVLVLALFAVYWVIVVVILVAARDVYDQALPQEAVRLAGNQRSAEIGVLLVATALFAVLAIGVIRGWRWTFWLILVVFLAGILRVPSSALQLAGIVPSQDPAWYVVLQAVVYPIQFVIALAMLAGYRKAGAWGAF
jgi:nitrate reductase NapE component